MLFDGIDMGYRILVINWQDIRNPLGGGAEVHFHEIFKRIVQRGHEVTLLSCAHPSLPPTETLDGIQVVRHGSRRFFNYEVPRLYRHYSRKRSFDIVVDDINKIPFYTPLFVKEPLIGIVHHLFGSSIFMESSLPIALYVTLAERLIPRVYRHVPLAVVSESTRQELIQKGLAPESLHLVGNAVDHSAYPYCAEKRSPQPLVGYLGRIKKYKSVDHLILAFSKVVEVIPSARLLIVGDGDHLVKLKKLACRLGVEQLVEFAGAINHQQKIEYLNRMWLAVNPSPKEGWGLTVIEANCCGVPVVAANSPGLRDSVVDGHTGLLYPFGDIDALAERIIRLIQNDSLRQTLSQQGIQWAHQFNWEHSAIKMLHLIENVLSRRK